MTSKNVKKGKKLVEEKKFEEAHRAFYDATKDDPKDKDAWIEMGDMLSNKENRNTNYQSALDAYLKVVDLDPKDVEGWKNIGRVCVELRQVAKGIKAYERAYQLKPPKAVDEWSMLGSLYRQTNDWSKLIGCSQKILELDPKNIDAMLAIASGFLELTQWDKVKASLDNVLQLDPNNYRGLYLLGVLMNFTGKFKDAESPLVKAIKIKPNVAMAWEKLGEIYINLEQKDAALYCYQEAEKLGDITGVEMAKELLKAQIVPQKPKILN